METQKINPKNPNSSETKSIDNSSLDLAIDLSSLGVKLKDWDGMDIEFIAPSMKKALESCKIAFEQSSNSDLLLCALLIQLGVSNAITKALMGNVFKMKAVDPQENVESMKRLSAEIIALSSVVNNKEEFSSKLKSLLVYVYSNDLIPGFSRIL